MLAVVIYVNAYQSLALHPVTAVTPVKQAMKQTKMVALLIVAVIPQLIFVKTSGKFMSFSSIYNFAYDFMYVTVFAITQFVPQNLACLVCLPSLRPLVGTCLHEFCDNLSLKA
jgi:hypothetical protein